MKNEPPHGGAHEAFNLSGSQTSQSLWGKAVNRRSFLLKALHRTQRLTKHRALLFSWQGDYKVPTASARGDESKCLRGQPRHGIGHTSVRLLNAPWRVPVLTLHITSY